MIAIISIIVFAGFLLTYVWITGKDTMRYADDEQKKQQAAAQYVERVKHPPINWQLPAEKLITISVDDFQPYAAYATMTLRDKYYKALICGDKYIEIPIADYEEARSKCTKRRIWERDCAMTCCRNNEGIAFEKDGKIGEAIKVYEENIELGFPAMHSYTRLMIIYRRLKDYDNEQRVIRRAIEVYVNAGLAADEVEKWKLRMEKSKLLQIKQKK